MRQNAPSASSSSKKISHILFSRRPRSLSLVTTIHGRSEKISANMRMGEQTTLVKYIEKCFLENRQHLDKRKETIAGRRDQQNHDDEDLNYDINDVARRGNKLHCTQWDKFLVRLRYLYEDNKGTEGNRHQNLPFKLLCLHHRHHPFEKDQERHKPCKIKSNSHNLAQQLRSHQLLRVLPQSHPPTQQLSSCDHPRHPQSGFGQRESQLSLSRMSPYWQ